jgi:hypothetical protein
LVEQTNRVVIPLGPVDIVRNAARSAFSSRPSPQQATSNRSLAPGSSRSPRR